jgi:phage tail sheath gpL-like
MFALSRLLLLVVFSLVHPVIAADEPTTPSTDSEIQQCIAAKLAASPALKDQGFTATVSNGAVTLTGVARNPGSKGNATRIAKKCGATSGQQQHHHFTIIQDGEKTRAPTNSHQACEPTAAGGAASPRLLQTN